MWYNLYYFNGPGSPSSTYYSTYNSTGVMGLAINRLSRNHNINSFRIMCLYPNGVIKYLNTKELEELTGISNIEAG